MAEVQHPWVRSQWVHLFSTQSMVTWHLPIIEEDIYLLVHFFIIYGRVETLIYQFISYSNVHIINEFDEKAINEK